MGRIVGIDFGTARIGLAVSDPRRVIAQPLETVQVGKNDEETIKKVVATLSKYGDLTTVVIGLPLLLSGKEGQMTGLVRAFAHLLEKALALPIVFWDERLTSAGVEKMLVEMDVSRKKRAALSDALSAVSILQNYLDALL